MPRNVVIAGRILTEHDLDCPDCNHVMFLTAFKSVLVYRCARRDCTGSHSANQDGSPAGIPGNWEVRAARKKAHSVFSLLISENGGILKREAATRWLQGALGLTQLDANISRFDCAQCAQFLVLARQDFGLEPEPDPGMGRVGYFDVTL